MRRLLTILLISAAALAQTTVTGSFGGQVGSKSAVSAADANFAARCATAGVLVCDGLNTTPTVNTSGNAISGLGFPDFSAGSPTNATLGSNTLIADPAVFVSGNGSLKIYKNQDAGDTAGYGNISFDAPGHVGVQFCNGCVNGNDFYFQYRRRMDANALAMNNGVPDGLKDFIFTAGNRWFSNSQWVSTGSCSDFQFVMLDGKYRGFPNGSYLDCHGPITLSPLSQQTGSTDQLYQNSLGGLQSKTGNAPAVTVTSLTRTSNIVHGINTGTNGFVDGDTIYIVGANWGTPTSTSETTFNGRHVVCGVAEGCPADPTATSFYYKQQGIDEGTTNAVTCSVSSANGVCAQKFDLTNIWSYQADEWETFQCHIIMGGNFNPVLSQNPTTMNPYRNSTVECWAAHENQPSVLFMSIPDTDIRQTDSGNTASGTSPFTSPAKNWWASQSVIPGYGTLQPQYYQSNRAPSTASIKYVARSGGISQLTWNGTWIDCCSAALKVANPTSGFVADTFIVSGATDTTFNGTFQVCGTADGCPANPGTTTIYYKQAGQPDVAANTPAGAGATAQKPANVINCNGGPCATNVWYDELIVSTHRIPDPITGIANPVPDPPDHLTVTAVDAVTGNVSLQWVDNADNETAFTVQECPHDKYECNRLQGVGPDPWVTVGTAASVAGRYGTQAFTYTAPDTTTLRAFRVYATNANGNSAWSNNADNTPGIPNTVVASQSGTAVNVTWVLGLPRVETSVLVQRCTGQAQGGLNNAGPCTDSDAVNWSTIATLTCATPGTCATSYTDSTVSTSTTYVYRVQAQNAAGFTYTNGTISGYNKPYGGNNIQTQVSVVLVTNFAPTCGTAPCVAAITGQGGLGTQLMAGYNGTSGGQHICPPNGYGNTTNGYNYQWDGNSGTQCVGAYTEWASFIANTSLNKMCLPWSGGHAGYPGTEIYCLLLNTNPPNLTRVSNPEPLMSAVGGGAQGNTKNQSSMPIIWLSQFQCTSATSTARIYAHTPQVFPSVFQVGRLISVANTNGAYLAAGGVDTDYTGATEATIAPITAVDPGGAWVEYTHTCASDIPLTAASNSTTIGEANAALVDNNGQPNAAHLYGGVHYDYRNHVVVSYASKAVGVQSGGSGGLWVWDNPDTTNAICSQTAGCSGTAPHVYQLNTQTYINGSSPHPPGFRATTQAGEVFIDDDGAKDFGNTGENYLYFLNVDEGKLRRLCANGAATGCSGTYLTNLVWTTKATGLIVAGDKGWAQIDPVDGVMLYAGNLSGTPFFKVINLSTGAISDYTDVGGACAAGPFAHIESPGFKWDPVAHNFFGIAQNCTTSPGACNASGPPSPYTISVNTALSQVSCAAVSPTGTGPVAVTTSHGGTFGKLQYFPSATAGDGGDVFVWCGDYAQNCFAYRLR